MSKRDPETSRRIKKCRKKRRGTTFPTKRVTGLYLVLPDGVHIKVSKKKIDAKSIVGERPIRYGVPIDDRVQIVDTATYPIFDGRAVYRILEALGVKIDWSLTDPKPEEGQEVPTQIKRLFPNAEDPIARLEGLTRVITTGITQHPLGSYTKGHKDIDGKRVDSNLVKRYFVAKVDDSGSEQLKEFPYLESTHFMPIKEKGGPQEVNVIPRIYQNKFLPEAYYELFASDDAGRFALWKLASKYMDEAFTFPNGEMGQAMIIIDGYHATSNTTQEYYAILYPEVYSSADGKEKFVWIMMTTKTRIKYAKGMIVPQEGEVPQTVQTQRRMLTPSVAVLLEGVL